MFSRMFPVLMALILVIAVVGCEGDTGPAGVAGATGATGQDGTQGPAGQDGDSVILAFGAINGDLTPPVIDVSWPATVTVTITKIAPGFWDVQLDGTFPSAEGVVMASSADLSADPVLTAFVETWSSTVITFTVGALDTGSGVLGDNAFTYLVLGQ